MKFEKAIFLILFFITVTPRAAHAVSYSPVPDQREEKEAKGIREAGETACFFESGTADVKKEIHNNDILIVYRENLSHQSIEVGKVKVLTYVTENFLKAVVIEGEVMTGDVAKKGQVASIVIPYKDQCK